MFGGSTRWSSTEINVTCRGCRGGSGNQSIVSGLAPVAKNPGLASMSSKLMEPDMSSLHQDHPAGDAPVVQVVERLRCLLDRVAGIENAAEVELPLHLQLDEFGDVPSRVDRA